ncbi:uncharacterized protein LOC118214660 isoform X2 [Anguilla anguilla]|uniref:uncharacterized protein LOC118214660 isoform X2 n=1 Tax=Anguilla anguilla TaxID=7936 RepID=UPI0015ADB68C|nr:uncharacterized protein LOC118214660 isoform X2 [Anguilla anguilla]
MTQPQLGLRTSVAVLLRALGGGYALGLATETATEVEELMLREKGPLVVTAVQAARVAGPSGVGVMLCCTSLALAFLSAATGVALGTGVTALMTEAGWSAHVTLGLAGAVVALGAVALGAGLGAAVEALIGVELTGIFRLLLIGTEIVVHLALPVKWQARNGLKQMKMFLTQVFIVMFIAVVLGLLEADSLGEKQGVVLGPVQGLMVAGLLLVPAAARLGATAEQALGRLPGHRQTAGTFLGRTFGNLVVLFGFLLGVGTGTSRQVRTFTMTLLHSLTPLALFLAGIVGAALGTMTLGLADDVRAEGVSVWVCTVVCVLLKALKAVADQWSVLLGTGSMVGALLGASGAAGLSLGAVGVASGTQFRAKGIALAVLGAAGGAVLGSARKTMRTVAVTLVAASIPRLAGMKVVVRIHSEATARVRGVMETLKGAVIGSVALGSAALGSAILGGLVIWTVACGTTGHYAVLVVSIITYIMNH